MFSDKNNRSWIEWIGRQNNFRKDFTIIFLLFRSTQNQVNRWTKSLFWFLHVKLVSNTLWPCQNINWLGDMKLTSINYSRYLIIIFQRRQTSYMGFSHVTLTTLFIHFDNTRFIFKFNQLFSLMA